MADTREVRARFKDIMGAVPLAFGVEWDKPTWTVYYRALEDVPEALLMAAVTKAVKGDSPFPPKPGEVRALAEAARKELIAANSFESCASCQHGWEQIDVDGVPRVRRCQCWNAHQARLQRLGVTTKPLALPPAQDRRYDGDAA